MAKEPREQQKTDAGRIGRQGTGKLDADRDRLAEADRDRLAEADRDRGTEPERPAEDEEPRPGRLGLVIGPTTGGADVQLEPGQPSASRRGRGKREPRE